MKHLLRLLTFFAYPVVAAWFLHVFTWPLMLEASELAGDVIQTALGTDGFDAQKFQSIVNDPRYARLLRIIHWSQVAFIFLSLIIAALLVPRSLKIKQTIDAVTAVAAGILTAKLVIGYPFLSWTEIFIWGAVSLCCVVVVSAARRHRGSLK